MLLMQWPIWMRIIWTQVSFSIFQRISDIFSAKKTNFICFSLDHQYQSTIWMLCFISAISSYLGTVVTVTFPFIQFQRVFVVVIRNWSTKIFEDRHENHDLVKIVAKPWFVVSICLTQFAISIFNYVNINTKSLLYIRIPAEHMDPPVGSCRTPYMHDA
jgi:hypothetical protein